MATTGPSDLASVIPMAQVRMAEEWYINTGGRVEGPLSVAELKDRAADGLLAPTDSVSPDGVSDWGPASAIPALTFPPRPRRPLLETVVSGSVSATAARAPVAAAAADVVVEGFEILETLGVGSFGAVYKAQQKTPKRFVALKTMLLDDGAGDAADHARLAEDALARFRKEADSQAQLQHPNIAAVYQCGICDRPAGRAYFAMELLAGEDFNVRLDRDGPVDEFTAWTIVRQAASALAHAQTHGIVHRDIKPANLFLVDVPIGVDIPKDVGFVKVTDFGLALSPVAADARQSAVSAAANAAAAVAGTPVYMAPEQFNGTADLRSDIYGLGATVYHALKGEPPFDGRSMWDVAMKKTSPAPRLPRPVSDETADLVAEMLEIDPAKRPPDYETLLDRIKNLPCMAPDGVCPIRPQIPPSKADLMMPPPTPPGSLADVSVSEPVVVIAPPPPVERWHHRRWVVAIAAAVVIGIVCGVVKWVVLWPVERPDNNPPVVEPQTKSTEPENRSHALFTPGKLDGWQGEGGSSWSIVQKGDPKNRERVSALTGTGEAVRKFSPPASFRVTLRLDFSETKKVEVVVAENKTGDQRVLIVINNADPSNPKVSFGKQAKGERFIPHEKLKEGEALPTAAELRKAGKAPFVELRYTRVADRIALLLGSGDGVSYSQLLEGMDVDELRINAIGGPVFIETVDLKDLTFEKKQ